MEKNNCEYIEERLSAVRKMIGMNMSKSAFSAPHVTLTTEVFFNKAAALRARLNDALEGSKKISFNDIVLYYTAKSLLQYPIINSTLQDNILKRYSTVNLGMAVSLDDGLIVPVIFDAQKKSLPELRDITCELAAKARKGTLEISQYTNGTFTVSNLGRQGIDAFTPIINPPQAAILGVGQIRDKAVIIDGCVKARKACTFSLSFDHRAVDGKQAGEFLNHLKSLIESAQYAD